MNLVQRTIHNLVKEYMTSDPWLLADYLDIMVKFIDGDETFHGVFMNVKDKKLIVLNEKYKHNKEGDFVLAHELYHAINHHDLVYFYHHGYNIKGKFEREANQFATYLLLVGKTIYEGQSNYDILKENYIPLDMIDYL